MLTMFFLFLLWASVGLVWVFDADLWDGRGPKLQAWLLLPSFLLASVIYVVACFLDPYSGDWRGEISDAWDSWKQSLGFRP